MTVNVVIKNVFKCLNEINEKSYFLSCLSFFNDFQCFLFTTYVLGTFLKFIPTFTDQASERAALGVFFSIR